MRRRKGISTSPITVLTAPSSSLGLTPATRPMIASLSHGKPIYGANGHDVSSSVGGREACPPSAVVHEVHSPMALRRGIRSTRGGC